MEADFASVWGRVTGTVPTENEQVKLQRWIRDETEAMRSYQALLRVRLPAPAAEMLRGLLREEHRELRQLQALYYLHTGDILVVALPEKHEKPTVMNALRERYDAALSQADSYRRATAERRDLASLCEELAEEKDGQALRLRQLTERLL